MSKQLAYAATAMLFVSVLLAFICVIFFPYASAYVIQLLQVLIPAIVAILTCYFGKSGFENYNKYKQSSDGNG